MAAHVPDEVDAVDADAPLHEPPLLMAAFEAVLVAAAGTFSRHARDGSV